MTLNIGARHSLSTKKLLHIRTLCRVLTYTVSSSELGPILIVDSQKVKSTLELLNTESGFDEPQVLNTGMYLQTILTMPWSKWAERK